MPELTALSELIPNLSANFPYESEVSQIYALFERDFIQDGVLVDSVPLRVFTHPSNFPLLRGKSETFVHIVTRENKLGYREFDVQRANRVHWIKPILLHVNDSRIFVFDKSHDKTGKPQRYFWYKDKAFVVILRHTHGTHYLLTAFCVDAQKERQFLRWFNKGQCNKKPHIMCGARNLGIATE